MKSNETALSYFLIREIIKCFITRLHYMEENDIINYVLIELKENNVTENLDKTNLDFEVVYMLFDLLEHLGMVTRKLENNQRFLIWSGFSQVKKKYGIVLKVDPEKISITKILNMAKSDTNERKYATYVEQFIAALFYQIYTIHMKEDLRYISSNDYEALKNDILFREISSKEIEERQKICKTLMHIMVYIGILKKHDL